MKQHSAENNLRKDQKKFPIKVSFRNYLWITGLLTLLGVGGGLAYYWFVGCKTGGCIITSSPYMSMIWGGAVGYLLPDIFVKKESDT